MPTPPPIPKLKRLLLRTDVQIILSIVMSIVLPAVIFWFQSALSSNSDWTTGLKMMSAKIAPGMASEQTIAPSQPADASRILNTSNSIWVKARLTAALKLTQEMIEAVNAAKHPDELGSFEAKISAHHSGGIYYGSGFPGGRPTRTVYLRATIPCEKLSAVPSDVTAKAFATLGKQALIGKLTEHRDAIVNSMAFCSQGALHYGGIANEKYMGFVIGQIETTVTAADDIVLILRNPVATESIKLRGVKPLGTAKDAATESMADYIKRFCKNQWIYASFETSRTSRNDGMLTGVANCGGSSSQSIGAALITKGFAQMDYATLDAQTRGEYKLTYLLQLEAARRLRKD